MASGHTIDLNPAHRLCYHVTHVFVLMICSMACYEASSIALGSGFRNITGTSGADSLKGNDQFNTINGGNGKDTFVFLAGGSAENGINLITDFTVGTDKIRIQWEGNGSPTDLAGLGLTLSGSSRVQLRDSVTNELIANFSGVSQSALQNQIDSDFSSVFEIV